LSVLAEGVDRVHLIPTRHQWSDWSLPSKLTAIGTLIGILSLGLYLGEKSVSILKSSFRPTPPGRLTTPPVALVLDNTTGEQVTIQRRGDFVLWLPQGVDDLRRLPGRYDLETVDGERSNSVVVIGPRAEARVLAQLHSEVALAQLLDTGAADIEFILRKEQGDLLFSGSIPFNRKAVTTTCWKIDLARKE
jgi:hypothetical protein